MANWSINWLKRGFPHRFLLVIDNSIPFFCFMDDRSLKYLEFFHLLDILKEDAVSPLGRKRCEALRPLTDLPTISSRFVEVMEMIKILEAKGEIPLQGLKDIGGILRKLEIEGAILEVGELLDLHQHIILCRGIKRFFQKIEQVRAPYLQAKISQLSSQKLLEKAILRTINTRGEVLDHASPALLDIRHRLKAVRERIQKLLEHLLHREDLQSIFQEQFVTIRNGRYVLPIRSDAEHRLDGIIHDHSQSRMTYFLEPLQIIGLNNEMSLLEGEEKGEVYRILGALSKEVREVRQDLEKDLDIVGELDFLSAVSKLSLRLKATSPSLNEVGRIEMKEARNPLLALQREDQVVPIDVRMEDGIKVLIVSGANAGGKTVALKTLGLLTLMAQCGLPIPVAEGSQVRLFHDVFAVIGDEQDIEKNLSSFSSHLLHVNQIYEDAGPRSLVLLDELGVGTQAQEGCALAMGFLDRFREKGASVVVTTHYDRLKVYGYLHPDVENVAVAFDEETQEPRYRLVYGSSGSSNAFLIAEKLGISKSVLEAAHTHWEGSQEEVMRALEILERLKREAEEEKRQASRVREELLQERQKLEKIVETIREKKAEIYSKAEQKAGKAVWKVEEELKEYVRRRKEEKMPLPVPHQELQAIREKFFPSIEKEVRPAIRGRLKVGERVRIERLRSNGIVVNIPKPSKQAEVLTDRAKIKAPLSEIVQISSQEPKGERGDSEDHPFLMRTVREPASQLKVVGLTVEDALSKVDLFIDQAILHGLEKVQIIHGVGSGRLQEAIRQFLKGHRAVKNYSYGESLKGGRGVTIVELK